MSRDSHFVRSGKRAIGLVSGLLLITCVFAVAAAAQPPEAETVMAGMVDAKIIEEVDYAFLAVAYDESEDVLYFAAADGEHYDPAIEVVYSIPIEAINHVNVTSNSDVTPAEGKPYSRGCSVKLVAKEADFGWAGLDEGWVTDGEFAVEYEELVVEPMKEVDIGFYHCDHARRMQMEFQKLHKQVKKGS